MAVEIDVYPAVTVIEECNNDGIIITAKKLKLYRQKM